MTNDLNENDVEWLALCYSAGEMDAAAAEEFEARLSTDQSAREALARAVELSQAVLAVESQCGNFVTRGTPSPDAWRTRLSWMAIGGVASLLLALLGSSLISPSGPRLTAAVDQNLVRAWTTTGNEIASAQEAGLWPVQETLQGELDDLTSPLDSLGDEFALDEAPSWLLAAVYSEAIKPLEN